jgi:hypothetical protein
MLLFLYRLLAYYTVLTSLCPQVLANEYTQPAIEVNLALYYQMVYAKFHRDS